jgi:hypothetical protein
MKSDVGELSLMCNALLLSPGGETSGKRKPGENDLLQRGSDDSILFPKLAKQGHQVSAEHGAEGIERGHVRALIARFESGSVNGEGPDAQVSLYPSKLFFSTLVQ